MVRLLLCLAPAYVLFCLYLMELAGFGLGGEAWRLTLSIGAGVWLLLAGLWIRGVLTRAGRRRRGGRSEVLST